MSYLAEVERSIKLLPALTKPPKWLAVNYVGAGDSRLKFLEIKTPLLRKRFKDGYSFSQLPSDQQWKIWDQIWHTSKYFEVMNHAFYFTETRSKIDLLHHIPLLLKWQKRVDNWAHSDSLSSHYARFLEHDPKLMLPILEQWSVSKNPWDNRQSLVSLFFYSRMRKKFVPFIKALKLIKRQLHHEHYYVQKGVGWSLRELYNVYPQETYEYLQTVAKDLSPAAWTAATESLTSSQKARLKASRK